LADGTDKTDAILGGVPTATEEDDGEVIAVFGEIVEVGKNMLIVPQSTNLRS
jgi:hypothetical protein